MAKSFMDLFIIFSLIGVFVFSIMSFGIVLQQDNNVNITILEDERINNTFIRLGGNLTSSRDVTQEQKEGFESDIPERGFGSLIIFSILSVGQTFTAIIVSVFNILIFLPASILGISSVVIGVFESILLVSLVLLVWRVYRIGS